MNLAGRVLLYLEIEQLMFPQAEKENTDLMMNSGGLAVR